MSGKIDYPSFGLVHLLFPPAQIVMHTSFSLSLVPRLTYCHRRRMYWAGSYEIKRARHAINIQRVYRGYRVRRLALVELKIKRNFRRYVHQATVIQTAYRGYFVRKGVGKLVVRAINDLVDGRQHEVNSAAVVYIQARARSRLARRRMWATTEVQAQRLRDQIYSAILLQCAYRCYLARVLLAHLRLEKLISDR